MKKLLLLLVVLLLVNCSDSTGALTNDNTTDQENKPLKTNNCNYPQKFKKLNNLIQERNIDEVSKICTFPFEDHKIWHLVYFNSPFQNYDINKPFTENEFKVHFDSIFTSDFLICLAEVNIDELFNSGESYTDSKEVVENEFFFKSFNMKILYDSTSQEITINLNYIFNDYGEKYESSIIYKLIYDKCQLKLNEVLTVG